MTDTQKYKYLRRVLRLIILKRRWRNGQLLTLAAEALRRVG